MLNITEAFDFNAVKKQSMTSTIVKNYKNNISSLIKEFSPLFQRLKAPIRNGDKFEPNITVDNGKCVITDENNFLLIDFFFDGFTIQDFNVYNTAYTTFEGGDYCQVISIIFYITTQIPYKINNLNFLYDRPSITYKLEGQSFYPEMKDLTEITVEYVNKLPEHINFNYNNILLNELRFWDESAIKAFIYKLRKDNPNLKFKIKHCQYITETPYYITNIRGRNKGETSKLIRQYIKAPVNTLLETFDFNNVSKKNNIQLSNEGKKYMLDQLFVELTQKKIIDSISNEHNNFAQVWRPPHESEFDGIYYNIECAASGFIIHLTKIVFVFNNVEEYHEVCDKLTYFKNIKIDGTVYIGFYLKNKRKQRLENFGNLNKGISEVTDFEIHNIILHDFAGMPKVKRDFLSNECQIISFENFNYDDHINDISLYYKPSTLCPYSWKGFPEKISGLFTYQINYIDDEYYSSELIKHLTNLKEFPVNFSLMYDYERMKSAQCHFVNINQPKWQRDKIKSHIKDLLIQEIPNAQKRDRLFKILTKIYRYR